MKKMIFAIVTMIAFAMLASCETDADIYAGSGSGGDKPTLNYGLQQNHVSAEVAGTKLLDDHEAWLKGSDGSTTEHKPYTATFAPDYTQEVYIDHGKGSEVENKTVEYKNGFALGNGIITISFEMEKCTSVYFDENGKEYVHPELKVCTPQPIRLKSGVITNNHLPATITVLLHEKEYDLPAEFIIKEGEAPIVLVGVTKTLCKWLATNALTEGASSSTVLNLSAEFQMQASFEKLYSDQHKVGEDKAYKAWVDNLTLSNYKSITVDKVADITNKSFALSGNKFVVGGNEMYFDFGSPRGETVTFEEDNFKKVYTITSPTDEFLCYNLCTGATLKIGNQNENAAGSYTVPATLTLKFESGPDQDYTWNMTVTEKNKVTYNAYVTGYGQNTSGADVVFVKYIVTNTIDTHKNKNKDLELPLNLSLSVQDVLEFANGSRVLSYVAGRDQTTRSNGTVQTMTVSGETVRYSPVSIVGSYVHVCKTTEKTNQATMKYNDNWVIVDGVVETTVISTAAGTIARGTLAVGTDYVDGQNNVRPYTEVYTATLSTLSKTATQQFICKERRATMDGYTAIAIHVSTAYHANGESLVSDGTKIMELFRKNSDHSQFITRNVTPVGEVIAEYALTNVNMSAIISVLTTGTGFRPAYLERTFGTDKKKPQSWGYIEVNGSGVFGVNSFMALTVFNEDPLIGSAFATLDQDGNNGDGVSYVGNGINIHIK